MNKYPVAVFGCDRACGADGHSARCVASDSGKDSGFLRRHRCGVDAHGFAVFCKGGHTRLPEILRPKPFSYARTKIGSAPNHGAGCDNGHGAASRSLRKNSGSTASDAPGDHHDIRAAGSGGVYPGILDRRPPARHKSLRLYRDRSTNGARADAARPAHNFPEGVYRDAASGVARINGEARCAEQPSRGGDLDCPRPIASSVDGAHAPRDARHADG